MVAKTAGGALPWVELPPKTSFFFEKSFWLVNFAPLCDKSLLTYAKYAAERFSCLAQNSLNHWRFFSAEAFLMTSFCTNRRIAKCSHTPSMLRFRSLASHKNNLIIDDFLFFERFWLVNFAPPSNKSLLTYAEYAAGRFSCLAQNSLNHWRFFVFWKGWANFLFKEVSTRRTRKPLAQHSQAYVSKRFIAVQRSSCPLKIKFIRICASGELPVPPVR